MPGVQRARCSLGPVDDRDQSGGLHCRQAGGSHLVARREEDNPHLVEAHFTGLKPDIRCHDHEIAHPHELRGGSIHLDLPGLAVDHIGCETGAISDVIDITPFKDARLRLPGQGPIDRDRTFVIGIGGRELGAMEFGFEKGQLHSKSRGADRFSVQLYGVLQAVQDQLRHNLIEEPLRLEHAGEPACADDVGFAAGKSLGRDGIDQMPDSPDMPMVEPGIYAFGRGPAQRCLGAHNRDVGQFGGVTGKGRGGDTDAGQDCTTEILTRGGNHIEGRGCTAVHDDEIPSRMAERAANRIGNAVGAHLVGIAIEHLEPGFYPGLEDERFGVVVLDTGPLQRMQRRWHDRAQCDLFDLLGLDAMGAKHRREKDPEFVGGCERVRGLAKRATQDVAVEDPAENLAVADIKTKEHGRWELKL